MRENAHKAIPTTKGCLMGTAERTPNGLELSKELRLHAASVSVFFLFLPKRVKHTLQVGHFLPSLSK